MKTEAQTDVLIWYDVRTMNIQAVLFDVDGTLIDTSEYIYQAYEHSLGRHNHDMLSREALSHLMGKSLEDTYREITGLDVVNPLMDAHREYQLENAGLAVAFPNSASTLESLRKKGISIGAVTTRARDTAIETLEHAELFPLIDFFVAFEDVVSPKPDPEGIKKALDFFNVHPSDAIMIGDSPVDVEAGKNAKTHTIGVTYGFHGERIVETEPDYVIDDISEIIEIVDSF